ncbi:hypothetical protein ACI1UN_03865 [Lactococcus petauri]
MNHRLDRNDPLEILIREVDKAEPMEKDVKIHQMFTSLKPEQQNLSKKFY